MMGSCLKNGDSAKARAYNAHVTSWCEIVTIMGQLGDAAEIKVR